MESARVAVSRILSASAFPRQPRGSAKSWRLSASVLAAAMAGASYPAAAQIVRLALAPETPLALGSLLAARTQPVRETLSPVFRRDPIAVGPLPEGVGVATYDETANGERLLVVDTVTILPGVGAVGPRDLVRWTGTTYVLELATAPLGVSDGAVVDAMARVVDGPSPVYLLSFDTAVEMTGGGVADDEDVVFCDGASLAVWNDLTGTVDPALDLDALDYDATSFQLYLSFDGSGTAGGVSFDDEDVVVTDGLAWGMTYDASFFEVGWEATDLAALSLDGPGIFSDGFESGGTGAWSNAVP